jgi:hypothetical protein
MVRPESPVCTAVACAVMLLVGGAVHAQALTVGTPEVQTRSDAPDQELFDPKQVLQQVQWLRQQYVEQSEWVQSLERRVVQQQAALDALRGVVSRDRLALQRGTGTVAVPAGTQPDNSPVGQAPASEGRPPEVAPIFEQPGVLTQPGQYVLEPSLQYGYSSSNRVALVGYTVIPALLIGLVDVREVKRNTVTGALAARFGVTKRLELELRAPYVYRSDATVSREIFQGAANERVFSNSGQHPGDLEIGARYQLNEGGIDKPFYISALRLKSRTGTSPFDVVTDCAQRCVGNTTGTGLPLDLPSGSGFYSMQAGLTALFPSDPAVFFGSVTYMHNFPRNDVSRKVLNGEREYLGRIAPGNVLGFNFGMGLALNEKSSFSIGYDHSSIARTLINGQPAVGSVRTQLATLLLGYSYRLSNTTSLNVSVGAGLTRDTPDVSLTIRLPMSF